MKHINKEQKMHGMKKIGFIIRPEKVREPFVLVDKRNKCNVKLSKFRPRMRKMWE
jgi:hypothetical protein